jgi:hypothetical protein
MPSASYDAAVIYRKDAEVVGERENRTEIGRSKALLGNILRSVRKIPSYCSRSFEYLPACLS